MITLAIEMLAALGLLFGPGLAVIVGCTYAYFLWKERRGHPHPARD